MEMLLQSMFWERSFSMAVAFKELRQYISRVVRISVCFTDGH